MNKILLGVFIMMAFAGMSAYAEPGSFATFKVGDVTLTALSDVSGETNTEKLIGYDEKQKEKLTPTDKVGFYENAFIVTTKGKNVLVDTGMGKGAGKMADAMAKANIPADKIDIVILTHMHGDHIGGLLTDGKVSFPKAELWISALEKKYWYDDNKDKDGNFALARNVIDAYGKKVKTFNFGDKITPEIMSMGAVGHTPGHTAYLIASGDDKLLIWGDIVHVTEVQFPLPQIAIKYDIDPEQAVKTRMKIMNDAVKNNWRIAGMHLPFPAVGKIAKKGDGFEWQPEKSK